LTDSLAVIMDGAIAGIIVRHQGGRLRFDYNDEYRSRANATPLSLSVPTQVRSHPDHVVTLWLQGLLRP
jgi:serine/threonine-protein kinase HipA